MSTLSNHWHVQQQPFVMDEGLLSIIPAGCLRADDGPLIVIFGSTSPHQQKKKKKNVVKVGPPLTKLFGSVHDQALSDGEPSVSTPVKHSHLIPMAIV